jgi:hypothetical protein
MSAIIDFPGTPHRRIRTLKCMSKLGERYQRRTEVEQQIECIVATPLQMWPQYARTRFNDTRVKNETIVYLIRETWDLGENEVLLDLHRCLFDRMATIIRHRAHKLGLRDCPPVAEYVQAKLMDRLYRELASPAAEYLEVSFGAAVVAEVHRWNRKHGEYWRRLDLDADEPTIDRETVGEAEYRCALSLTEIDNRIDIEQLVRLASTVLATPHFEAFYLHFVEGVPVEDHATRIGLQTMFSRRPRVIYLWLERAIDLLKKQMNRRPGDE